MRPTFHQGRSTEEDDSRDGRTLHRSPNTYLDLRSRVAACVGEMIQQSHAPTNIGEVEGELEGSDGQIDEHKEAAEIREVDTQNALESPPSGRHEKRPLVVLTVEFSMHHNPLLPIETCGACT